MENQINNSEKMIDELREQIEQLLNDDKADEALKIIDAVIQNKYKIDEDIVDSIKIGFASYYIEVAEIKKIGNSTKETHNLVNRAFGIFNQFSDEVPELLFFINCSRAKGNSVKADSVYIEKQKEKNNRILNYEYSDSIFEVRDFISDGIKNYWDALKVCNDPIEVYNIKNNLARLLSRVGRNIEALELLAENIKADPKRFQSNASYAHCLTNLLQSSLVPETASLHLVISEKYYAAIKSAPSETIISKLKGQLQRHSLALKEMNYELTEDLVEVNLTEEGADYTQHNEYRKFVLSNNLHLSEHALYCRCRDSGIDNLKIGISSGSRHLGKPSIFPKLDALLNRTISEFAYSRLLYYQYASGISSSPLDLDFSTLSNYDLTGYNIEQLRTSYRIAYGILDKIANGILLLLEIPKNNSRDSYFENVFDIYKEDFKKVSNLHLTALYSISVDLNKDYGSLRHFKQLRNELEHGFLAINTELNKDITTHTEQEMKTFTLDLLKLTRSVIFNFTFLVRTHTIS